MPAPRPSDVPANPAQAHLSDSVRATLACVLDHYASTGRPIDLRTLQEMRFLTRRSLRYHLAALHVEGLISRWITLDGTLAAPPGRMVGMNSPQESDFQVSIEVEGSLHKIANNPSSSSTNLKKLLGAGVFHGLAQEISHLPWVTPDLIEAWTRALRSNNSVRHVGAMLATVLRDRTRCLPPPPLLDADSPSRANEPYGGCGVRDPEAPPPIQPPDPGLAKLDALWQRVIVRLRDWQPDAVEQFLDGSHVLSVEDGVLCVTVPTSYARDWLSYRADAAVQAALANESDTLRWVVFVVARGQGAWQR